MYRIPLKRNENWEGLTSVTKTPILYYKTSEKSTQIYTKKENFKKKFNSDLHTLSDWLLEEKYVIRGGTTPIYNLARSIPLDVGFSILIGYEE